MTRFKQIDILRALAVFLVLGRHMAPCPLTASPFLHQLTSIWALGGWVGVDLFFVLSGFLVSGLLFREYGKYRELRIGQFLIRRGFKIYPPFWLLIAVTFVFMEIRHQPMSWQVFASELLFLQNYLFALWNHTWSLAVEEHFYLLLAFGFFLLSRRRGVDPFTPVPAIFVLVALLCLGLRIYVGAHTPFLINTHVFPSHLRLDSLFFGVLLAYFFYRDPAGFNSVARRWRYPLLAAGILLLLPAFRLPMEKTPWLVSYGLTMIYVGGGCLLVAALGFPARPTRLVRGIAYAGSHSYSIYLWHLPVRRWIAEVFAGPTSGHYNWFLYALIYLAGSILLGIGMALVCEFPVLRVRDRFFPSRGSPLSTKANGHRPVPGP